MADKDTSSVSPERLMQISFGYAPTLLIEAAVRHRVFDELAGGSKTITELCTATGVSKRGMRIMVNALVGLELLAVDQQRRYSLTPESSEYLVGGKQAYMGGFFKHASSQLMPKWLALNEIIRTG